jgi:hypothetical protein
MSALVADYFPCPIFSFAVQLVSIHYASCYTMQMTLYKLFKNRYWLPSFKASSIQHTFNSYLARNSWHNNIFYVLRLYWKQLQYLLGLKTVKHYVLCKLTTCVLLLVDNHRSSTGQIRTKNLPHIIKSYHIQSYPVTTYTRIYSETVTAEWRRFGPCKQSQLSNDIRRHQVQHI